MRRVLGLGLFGVVCKHIRQTTFHGNVARTGVYESAGPAQLKGVKWTFKTGAAIGGVARDCDGVRLHHHLDGHLFAIDSGNW